MGANMHILATIFFREDLPISRHQYGYRIRQEKNFGGYDACSLVCTRMTNPGILQIDSVHKVVQCYVRVAPAQSRKRRSKKTHKCDQRITSERAEKQVKPDHVGFE